MNGAEPVASTRLNQKKRSYNYSVPSSWKTESVHKPWLLCSFLLGIKKGFIYVFKGIYAYLVQTLLRMLNLYRTLLLKRLLFHRGKKTTRLILHNLVTLHMVAQLGINVSYSPVKSMRHSRIFSLTCSRLKIHILIQRLRYRWWQPLESLVWF